MNYVEITFSDGTIARWIIDDDKFSENIEKQIEALLGPPDTTIL